MEKENSNTPDTETARLHAVISGLVQGVGFRAYVQSIATGMDLTGWVRNTEEGDVEVVLEGSLPTLVQMLKLLHRGPRAARVITVQEAWEPATGQFQYFSIRPTGYDR